MLSNEELEKEIVSLSARLDAAAFELERGPAARSVRLRQLPGGMVKMELVLEPNGADLLLRAVKRASEVLADQAEVPPPVPPDPQARST